MGQYYLIFSKLSITNCLFIFIAFISGTVGVNPKYGRAEGFFVGQNKLSL